MFKAFVLFSDDIDTEDAIEEILDQCDEQIEGLVPNAGLLFCGTEYEHKDVLKAINKRFPGIQLVGCTTDGEMTSSGGYSEDAISLTLICTDTIQVQAGYGSNAGDNPEGASEQALNMAMKGLSEKPSLALVMPDGLTSSAASVLAGFNDILGNDVPVVGGMSADRVGGSKDTYSTYQFCGDRVLTDSVPVLLFSGPLTYSLGVESGWSPIGKKMTVTKSDGSTLFELDHKPAFDLYVHYLGDVMKENIAGIGSYPLAVYEQGVDKYYLRVARAADTETGIITFLGEIPEGAEVQITQAIRDEIINGVDKSVESAIETFSETSEPALALMFSCTGRKIALGTKVKEEVSRVKNGVNSLPMAGFYTFGEIGPVSNHTRARYHNTTFVTLLLGEGKG